MHSSTGLIWLGNTEHERLDFKRTEGSRLPQKLVEELEEKPDQLQEVEKTLNL